MNIVNYICRQEGYLYKYMNISRTINEHNNLIWKTFWDIIVKRILHICNFRYFLKSSGKSRRNNRI